MELRDVASRGALPIIVDRASNSFESYRQSLRLVSLCLGSISVISAFIAFYWFLRIRRSFRHELIMLLIQSDLLKALWFVIFPIVELTRGRVTSSSTFCQVSGFFLTVGIEASDMAVLLIAIHTALYVFRPRQSAGERGLYPYRRYAYAAFVIVPLLSASLAFLNKPYAYRNFGAFCYLPVEPSWPRMALSWVPRYVIFLIIFFIYALIYIHLNIVMNRFYHLNSTVASVSESPSEDPRASRRPSTTSSQDPIRIPTYHDTISRRHSESDNKLPGSAGTAGTLKTDALPPYDQSTFPFRDHLSAALPIPARLKLENFSFDTSSRDRTGSVASTVSLPAERGDISPLYPAAAGGAPAMTRVPTNSTMARHHALFSPSEVDLRHDPRACARRQSSPEMTRRTTIMSSGLPSMFNRRLCGSVPTGSSIATTSHQLHVAVENSNDEPDRHYPRETKARDKIRRQLRLLFIYPLVYLIVWIAPFISHICNWDDPNNPGPEAAIVVSLASWCIQAAVDSWLFSTRERPWRYTRGRKVRLRRWHWAGRRHAAVGRTQEEMMVDGRLARRRRQEEIAQRQVERTNATQTARHWWDAQGDADTDSSDDEYLSSGARDKGPSYTERSTDL